MKNTKLYKEVINKDLSYGEALFIALNGGYITRPDWDGFHFIVGEDESNNYVILNKDKKILTNPEEIYDTEKKDWMNVEITDEAYNLLVEEGVLD